MRKSAIFSAGLLLGLRGSRILAADWPTYRAEAARTGYSPEELPAGLRLRWTYKPAHPPQISWPNEPLVKYDHAYQVAVAGGTLYYGSSADCQVRALEAATGRQKWRFFTGGPVRCAPAVWKDRVFVASDDGYLYCLAAKGGKLLWKKRGGPDSSMVIGGGRMISKWPARGGPAVADGVVYFAAGVWPADGTYLYALDAERGKELWSNKTAGALRRGHPHAGNFKDESGIGFQGYIAVGGDVVLVPTGRSLAAAFDRKTGQLRYFRVMANGGTAVAAVDSLVFDGGYVFSASDGEYLSRGVSPRALAASPEWIVHSRSMTVSALDRASPFIRKVNEKRKRTETVANVKWTAGNARAGGSALIIAGKTVYSAGGRKVVAVDAGKKSVVWSAQVDGEPCGLAAAGGRLYVSTDRGSIYCFDGEGGGAVIEERPAANPYGSGGPFAAAAEEILKKTAVAEGYCLDLGCGDGRLAFELARRSGLCIYGIEKDPAEVAEARRKLAAAGLYGLRVTVHQGDPARTFYPRRCAELIVCGRSVAEGAGAVPEKEAARLQRPWGGVACAGKPGAMRKNVRGPLAGAGQWTHQYGSAAGSASSEDRLVRGPLTVRWFGGPDMEMPNRHGRAPGPLFLDGRLYVMGLDALRAIDAYNGRVLWEVPFKGIGKPYDGEHLLGTAGTNGTFCAAPEGVFVRYGAKCRRLDGKSGEKLGEFALPGDADGVWGFVACAGGRLFGSEAETGHRVPYYYGKADMSGIYTESKLLFAMDAKTGKPLWSYRPRESIRHNAVAIGGGRVHLIDREKAEEEPRYKKLKKPHKPGDLVAMDAKTGRELWRKAGEGWGTVLALSAKHDVLLMSYQPAFKGFGLTSDEGRKLAAFRASSGERLWEEAAQYVHRPVIIGRTVWLSRGKLDLLTGKREEWRLSRYHGCGMVVGAENLLLFRSAVLGYVELGSTRRTRHWGGIRPGCWVHAIPAGGMVLMPEFSEKCGCAYLNKTSLALEAARESK